MHKNLSDFLAFRKHVTHRLSVEYAFIDLCAGDHLAAIMLSSLLDAYSTPAADDVIVERADRVWLARSWHGWFRLTRLRRKQGFRVLRKLEELGYVSFQTFQLVGRRRLHIALRHERFLRVWNDLLAGVPPSFATEPVEEEEP